MSDLPKILAADEERILTAVGYLVMRWNDAEHFARQILRVYLTGDSLLAADHIKLSKGKPKALVERLRQEALPNWGAPGRPYLQRLIEAFSVARDHRNHIVHGIRMTVSGNGVRPAQAILTPNEPFEGQIDLGRFAKSDEIEALAHYFHNLAVFAREVAIAFGPDGSTSRDQGGKEVVPNPPEMIKVLQPVARMLIGIEML